MGHFGYDRQHTKNNFTVINILPFRIRSITPFIYAIIGFKPTMSRQVQWISQKNFSQNFWCQTTYLLLWPRWLGEYNFCSRLVLG